MRFRWWMAPAIGVGIVALANAALIFTAVRVRPQKTEDRPYAASEQEDERAKERRAFAALGWRLAATTDGSGATLSLEGLDGARPGPAMVELYRPDDRSADRSVAWSEPARPLRLSLPLPGAWLVRVVVTSSDGTVAAGEVRLDRP